MRSGSFDGLGIEGIEISSEIRTPGQYTFLANLIDARPGPCCEQQDGNLVEWGLPERRFRDMKMQDNFVEVVTYPQKYRCRACNSTVRDQIPGLHDKHRMTRRLVDHLIKEAGNRTFSELARESGISVSAARDVFVRNMVEHMDDYEFEMPPVLGIDGKYIKGNYITVIGDIKNSSFLDMVGSTDIKVLSEYFKRRSNHDRVEVITADMEWTFRAIAEEFFPKAEVVIDKYHVVKSANEAMDRLRIDIGKSQNEETRLWYKSNRKVLLSRKWKVDLNEESREMLERMFTEQPRLKMAYEIKEGLFDIYKAVTRKEAEQRYIEWRKAMPLSMKKRFNSLPHAMKDKSRYIYNYFDHRYTNAYVESLNRLIGDIHRDGRGYEFEMLRAKTLIAHGSAYRERPEFKRVRVKQWTAYDIRDMVEKVLAAEDEGAVTLARNILYGVQKRRPDVFVRGRHKLMLWDLESMQPTNQVPTIPGEIDDDLDQLERE